MGNRHTKYQRQNKNSDVRMSKETNSSTPTITKEVVSDEKKESNLNAENTTVNVSVENVSVEDYASVNKEQVFFDWPVLAGFKDLKGEKARFQLEKNKLDKSPDLDVNKIIVGIAETSKKEDKQISKEKKLDDKRLHKITDGRGQINNHDNLGENLSRLTQPNNGTSTEGNVSEGENQDSIASAHEGEPKLSRRARARANRVSEQNDEQGVLHSVEGDEVYGQPNEVVQGTVPRSYPSDKNSVESNLQSVEAGSAKSLNIDGKELPSGVNEQGFAKGKVSNTPANEGKGSLDKLGKQIGTAESKGVQSLSVSQDKSVMKNASKGFFVLFSEKTDEILSPLSFVAHNHVKMAMAVLQLCIPLLLTYLLVNNVAFIEAGISSSSLPLKFVLYIIFYTGCLCASIFLQVLGSGIKGMFIKALIDAAAIGENKK